MIHFSQSQLLLAKTNEDGSTQVERLYRTRIGRISVALRALRRNVTDDENRTFNLREIARLPGR